jgi:hypothetical protein
MGTRPYRYGRVTPFAYNPISTLSPSANLSNFTGVWFAGDLALEDGEKVASWSNRVAGGAALTQSEVDNQPTFIKEDPDFGNRSSVRFDGNQFLFAASRVLNLARGTIVALIYPDNNNIASFCSQVIGSNYANFKSNSINNRIEFESNTTRVVASDAVSQGVFPGPIWVEISAVPGTTAFPEHFVLRIFDRRLPTTVLVGSDNGTFFPSLTGSDQFYMGAGFDGTLGSFFEGRIAFLGVYPATGWNNASTTLNAWAKQHYGLDMRTQSPFAVMSHANIIAHIPFSSDNSSFIHSNYWGDATSLFNTTLNTWIYGKAIAPRQQDHQCINFNTSGSFATISSNSYMNTPFLSVSAAVNISAYTVGPASIPLIDRHTTGGGFSTGWRLGITPVTSSTFRFYGYSSMASNTNQVLTTDALFNTNTSYFVTLAIGSNSIRLHVNGVEAAVRILSNTSSGITHLSGAPIEFGNGLSTRMSNAVFHARQLRPDEVTWLSSSLGF